MPESGAIAGKRLVLVTWIETNVARDRYSENVAEVGMARPGEVGVGEAEDRRIPVLVACGPRITLLVVADLGIRAQLNHPEGHGRPWESVATILGPDERIYLGKNHNQPKKKPNRPGGQQGASNPNTCDYHPPMIVRNAAGRGTTEVARPQRGHSLGVETWAQR